ncbi:dTDP-glucose 4,6-dehydratase [Candidatus Parcubacteria bacterium]|nr:MAG: dTDP-glucose 4,6-dehydratase [Candidatus Parcubacteria bacterium]
MHLLVTGGAGFIGSNFIHYIADKYPDYKIVNLDALTYAGNLGNLKAQEKNKNYTFVQGDIGDYDLVTKVVLEKDIDIIVNFAAESHVDNSITGPDPFIITNVLGTHNLLKVAKENKIRFHHVSTDEVFGSLSEDEAKFDENTAYDPRSPYSSSKASSDHIVRAYYHTYGLKTTISNCSNNYGPYQHVEKFIPLFITNLLQNKKVPLYGEGQNIRDWLYVEDHCRAIDLIINQGKVGETYLVGGDAEKRNIEIAKLLVEKLGQNDSMIEKVEDRLGHDFRYAIDFSKIKNELGWEPQVSFTEGLDKTIDWYKNNKAWWEK